MTERGKRIPEDVKEKLTQEIARAIGHHPVRDLMELRDEMPAEYQGQVFDDMIVKLADDQRVIIYQDADPTKWTEEEKKKKVRAGNLVFNLISLRRNY